MSCNDYKIWNLNRSCNNVLAPHEADPNALYEKFRKMGVSEFEVGTDLMQADVWMARTEKIFKVYKCTGCQKVSLAAYKKKNNNN